MFALLLKGLLLGVTLSFIIGPLFFSIIESALQRGFRAGIAVASGIWTSDFMFIAVVVKGLTAMEALVALPGFKFWAGITGSVMLMLFGAGSLLNIKKNTATSALEEHLHLPPQKGYWPQWLKGFLINTINPGTLIFWLGTATGIVAPNAWNNQEIMLFFFSMMAVLMSTDLLKIYAAKRLRQWLTPAHILMVRRGIGMTLIGFGCVLALRSL